MIYDGFAFQSQESDLEEVGTVTR